MEKESAKIYKISIDPFFDSDMFVLPPETGGMVQVETSVGPLADLSEARMDENLSLVSPAGQILSVKNEEDEKRVKRRRMMRKCHLDGVLVGKEICVTGPLAAFMIFEHYTGTEWRNDTVSRA